MNKRYVRIFIIVLGFITTPLFSKEAFSVAAVDKVVKEYKERSSVLIVESSTCRIVYASDQEAVFTKRYPPGSIAKIWTMALFLERGAEFSFNPQQPYWCNGLFPTPREVKITENDRGIYNFNNIGSKKNEKLALRCSLRKGHGTVTLHKAVVQSCNCYFLEAASKNPEHLYRSINELWHFGNGTGFTEAVELPMSKNGSSFSRITAAIGEGGALQVTLLKVAQTFSALFAETPLLVPSYGGASMLFAPLEISKTNRATMVMALGQVLESGTLKSLNGGNTTLIGGKTGTATHKGKRYATHGWNVVCFNYKGILYTMVTFVEKGSGPKEARILSQGILNVL